MRIISQTPNGALVETKDKQGKPTTIWLTTQKLGFYYAIEAVFAMGEKAERARSG